MSGDDMIRYLITDVDGAEFYVNSKERALEALLQWGNGTYYGPYLINRDDALRVMVTPGMTLSDVARKLEV